MQKIIGVTGTPATGKTTLSNKLGKVLDVKVINLTAIVDKISTEFDSELETKIVDTEILKTEFNKSLSSEEEDMIIDGLLSTCLPLTHAIVLRVSPAVLWERLTKRGYSPKKVAENLEAELMGVCLYDSLWCDNVIEVDATKHMPFEQIVSWINSGGKSIKYVNWFEDFEKIIRNNL